MALADMDEMCRECISLEVVLITRSIMLSTTDVRLMSMENAGHIATAPRWKFCIIDP